MVWGCRALQKLVFGDWRSEGPRVKGRGEGPQRTSLAVARAAREMALCWYLLSLFQWSSLRYRLVCSSEQLCKMGAVTVFIVFIFNKQTASQRLAVLLKVT